MTTYECRGGPWDGKMVVMHEGNELRIEIAPPSAGIAMLTDEDASKPVESRVGIYRLVRSKSQPHPYLRWMGEE